MTYFVVFLVSYLGGVLCGIMATALVADSRKNEPMQLPPEENNDVIKEIENE